MSELATRNGAPKMGRKAFRKNPTRGYRGQGFGGVGGLGYYLTGEPWFTWQYVPMMLRDPAVGFGLLVKFAPLSRVKILSAKSRNREAAAWAAKTTAAFWQRDLPLLLPDFGAWGRMVGGAEWDVDPDTGRLELQQVRRVDPTECQPRVWAKGCNRGEFAGYVLSNATAQSDFIAAPNAFWFAGRQRLSPFADLPAIAGAFTPWMEKTSAGGARQTRRLFYWRDAVGINVIYYPVGTTKTNGRLVNNEDAARQTVEMLMNGSAVTLPNTPAPDGKSKAWEIDQRPARSDNAGIRDYPKDLDAEIWMGEGVPQEVIRAMDSGSGYDGRSIPTEVYLSDNDTTAGMIYRTFKDQILDHGLRANFGTTAVELELTNLVEQFRKEHLQGDGGRGDTAEDRGSRDAGAPVKKPSTVDLSGLRVMNGVRRKGGTRQERQERTARRAVALAMVRLKEIAHNMGEPDKFNDQIDSLSELADDPEELAKALGSVSLAWVEYGQSRSGVKRWRDESTGQLRYQKSRPGEHTEKRQHAHASAKAAQGIIRAARNGQATPEDLRQLATHIHAMHRNHLVAARKSLGATFRGGSRKDAMVQALINHVGGITPKATAPKGGGSIADAVKSFGGIDPADSDFKAHFSNVAEAREYGISLGVFRRGGAGFDKMAERLRDAGHLSVGEHENPTDALAEALRTRAKSDLADREKEYEDAYHAYYAAKQEAANREGANRGRKTKAAEGGAGGKAKADRGETEAGGGAEGGGGAGATDFNFGHNVKAEPPRTPEETKAAVLSLAAKLQPEINREAAAAGLRDDMNHMVPIHRVRAAFEAEYPGVPRQAFDDAVLAVRKDRAGPYGVLPATDRSRFTEKELKDGVYHLTDNLFHFDPRQKDAAEHHAGPKGLTPDQKAKLAPHRQAFAVATRRMSEPGRAMGAVMMRQDVIRATAKSLGVDYLTAEELLSGSDEKTVQLSAVGAPGEIVDLVVAPAE